MTVSTLITLAYDDFPKYASDSNLPDILEVHGASVWGLICFQTIWMINNFVWILMPAQLKHYIYQNSLSSALYWDFLRFFLPDGQQVAWFSCSAVSASTCSLSCSLFSQNILLGTRPARAWSSSPSLYAWETQKRQLHVRETTPRKRDNST